MSSSITNTASAVDHLIAADFALAQIRTLANHPVLGIQPQDLNEWVEQLRERLDFLPPSIW